MKIEFTISVIFLGAIIIMGFFSALVLLTRKVNILSNRILAAFIACTSLWLVDAFFQIGGVYTQDPNYYFKPIYYSFAFGPLIYMYVKSITNTSFKLEKKHLWHFIPVVIQASLYWFLNFKDYAFKNWYWQEIHFPYTYRIEFDGTFLSLAIYSFLSLRLMMSYQEWIKENYSETSLINLHWLKLILALLFVLSVQWFVEVILRDFYHNYYQFNYSVFVLGLITLVLAFRATIQSNLDHIEYKGPPLKESIDIDPSIVQTIRDRMQNEKDYLNPKLSLSTFAEAIKIPSRTISNHLNKGLDLSFQDFVNGYRIEEFKSKLAKANNEKFTIMGIAYDSGFNSKATFNRVFKKMTGFTPSQFLKNQSQNTE